MIGLYANAVFFVGALQFFVMLWDELQTQARRDGRGTYDNGRPAAVSVDYDQVRDKTSAAVGSSDGGVGLGLFDETVAAYAARRRTAQDFLIGALVDAHAKALWPYIGRVQLHWSTAVESHGALFYPIV